MEETVTVLCGSLEFATKAFTDKLAEHGLSVVLPTDFASDEEFREADLRFRSCPLVIDIAFELGRDRISMLCGRRFLVTLKARYAKYLAFDVQGIDFDTPVSIRCDDVLIGESKAINGDENLTPQQRSEMLSSVITDVENLRQHIVELQFGHVFGGNGDALRVANLPETVLPVGAKLCPECKDFFTGNPKYKGANEICGVCRVAMRRMYMRR